MSSFRPPPLFFYELFQGHSRCYQRLCLCCMLYCRRATILDGNVRRPRDLACIKHHYILPQQAGNGGVCLLSARSRGAAWWARPPFSQGPCFGIVTPRESGMVEATSRDVCFNPPWKHETPAAFGTHRKLLSTQAFFIQIAYKATSAQVSRRRGGGPPELRVQMDEEGTPPPVEKKSGAALRSPAIERAGRSTTLTLANDVIVDSDWMSMAIFVFGREERGGKTSYLFVGLGGGVVRRA